MGDMLSSMQTFLLAQPRRAAEREHSLHSMVFAPAPLDVHGFKERYGIRTIYTGYGASEISTVLCHKGDDVKPGFVGTVRAGYECRIVDENDLEVPEGTPGQLVVRSEQPWLISPRYVGATEASLQSWRNGWYHTGDLMRREGSCYFFVDRLSDSLRRRGENISASEVENAILQHPGIAEVACVPHREPGQIEDEVKVWLVPVSGTILDLRDIVEHCVAHMPYFAVPRFFEVVDALPKTPTQKVLKTALRERGNGERTWDREAAGLKVRRGGRVVSS
jgi:crotonobetaine/carnitine-CoA ligase